MLFAVDMEVHAPLHLTHLNLPEVKFINYYTTHEIFVSDNQIQCRQT